MINRLKFISLFVLIIGCSTIQYELGLKCKPSIGVSYKSNDNNRVDFSYPHSPGEALGIVEGDYLITTTFEANIGDEVLVKWIHLGKTKEEKIKLQCLNDILSWR